MLVFVLFAFGCGNSLNIIDNRFSDSVEIPEYIAETTEDTTQHFDFNGFLRKIWINDDWEIGGQNLSSFRLDRNDEGVVYGYFSVHDPAFPPVFRSANSHVHIQSNMTVSLNGNSAEGDFGDSTWKGNIALAFKERDIIEANIEYTNRGNHSPRINNGRFTYRPLTVADFDGFVVLEELSYETNLNLWGDVRFIAGEHRGSRPFPSVYLTDFNGNVIYYFETNFPNGSQIQEILVNDLNDDGFIDVIITAHDGPNYHFRRHFSQLENGWFYLAIEDNPSISEAS
jgi:hypothetical protein